MYELTSIATYSPSSIKSLFILLRRGGNVALIRSGSMMQTLEAVSTVLAGTSIEINLVCLSAWLSIRCAYFWINSERSLIFKDTASQFTPCFNVFPIPNQRSCRCWTTVGIQGRSALCPRIFIPKKSTNSGSGSCPNQLCLSLIPFQTLLLKGKSADLRLFRI